MWDIRGKTALVTGGAKRLGRETVLALSRRGANCVIHCRSSRGEAELLRSEVETAGVRAWIVDGDLSTEKGAADIFGQALTAASRIEILVNSASSYEEGTLENFRLEDLSRSAGLNAFAPLHLTRAFASQGIEGSVVMLLDARMNDYDRNHIGYHESKRILYSIMRMLAVDLSPRIRVNGVAPGIILPDRGKEEEGVAHLADTTPLKRTGTAEEVTETILFLLSNRFITGQVIFVDGGRHIRGSFY